MTRATEERLRFLLDTVAKERRHLLSTTQRLFAEEINGTWVASLEERLDVAERLDAFVARFGRLQDTLGDKLVPELLNHLLERTGATLDNLNRMERLGMLASVDDWVEARNLRNRLIHEYMNDPDEFAAALRRARELVGLLVDTAEKIAAYLAD